MASPASTSSEDELVPANTASASTAMNTLWQRGLQWYRRSKAGVVVRVDSPHTSGRPTASVAGGSGERPAAAASANHAAPSATGLVIAMQVLSSPDELPRILGVVFEREGLRALPKLAPVCVLWRDTLKDVVPHPGLVRVRVRVGPNPNPNHNHNHNPNPCVCS